MTDDFFDGTYLIEKDGKLIRKRDEPVCDFCCEKAGEGHWTYPCGFLELPLMDDPTGLPAVSDDPWCCCQTCKPFIDAKDWRGLAERSANVQIALAADGLDTSTIPEDLIEDWTQQITAHFERFDAARAGEPYQEPDND